MSRSCLTTRVLLATFVFLYMYTCLHTDGIDTWCSMNKVFCIRIWIFSNLTNSLVWLNKCLLYIFLLCFSFYMQYKLIFHAKNNKFLVSYVVPYVLCTNVWPQLIYRLQIFSWSLIPTISLFLSEQKQGASEQRIQLRTYELMDIFTLTIIY